MVSIAVNIRTSGVVPHARSSGTSYALAGIFVLGIARPIRKYSSDVGRGAAPATLPCTSAARSGAVGNADGCQPGTGSWRQ
jgi:hypothetical protein